MQEKLSSYSASFRARAPAPTPEPEPEPEPPAPPPQNSTEHHELCEFELKVPSGKSRRSSCMVGVEDVGVPMGFEFEVVAAEHWALPAEKATWDIGWTASFVPYDDAAQPDGSKPQVMYWPSLYLLAAVSVPCVCTEYW